MKISIETITPEIAHRYLELNTGNRRSNIVRIRDYAKAIKEGRWQENGDAIRFSRDRLIDGQHRLYAIVLANTPIKTLVVRDLDESTFTTIDTGKVRTGCDAMNVLGEKSARTLAGSIRFANSYYKGSIEKVPMTNDEMVSFLNENGGIRDSVSRVRSCKVAIGLVNESILSGLHYLFSLVDSDAADSFVKYLNTGAGYPPGSAIHKLRERLISNASSRGKLVRRDVAAIIIKTWNAQRTGKSLRVIKFLADEQFPTIL